LIAIAWLSLPPNVPKLVMEKPPFTTLTRKLPVAVFPRVLVAEQVTVVVPTENTVPDAGEQFTANVPSTTSDAEAVYLTLVPASVVVIAVISGGSDNTGCVVSAVIVMAALFDALVWLLLPAKNAVAAIGTKNNVNAANQPNRRSRWLLDLIMTVCPFELFDR
jgi:hypothetical protein